MSSFFFRFSNPVSKPQVEHLRAAPLKAVPSKHPTHEPACPYPAPQYLQPIVAELATHGATPGRLLASDNATIVYDLDPNT
jgi:hypothetical protein